MASYPLPTLAAQITADGVSYPSYADTLLSLQATFAGIYGSDAYLAEDSQDGQYLAAQAQYIFDANQACENTYLNQSPATAVGAGLSSNVKINGLRRNVPSNSQVTVTLGGTVGTVITSGQVADINGNVWNLPTTVVIGSGGSVDVTATATDAGALTAAPGDVNTIRTPTLGWQTVTNAASASAGEPVETDPQLRARQSQSVALPALTVLGSVVAALEALSGVVEVQSFENDTDTTDVNSIPPHSVAFVVNGGDSTAIAQTINQQKAPGAGTYGTTAVTVVDSIGISKVIHFFRPTNVSVKVSLTFAALTGYTSVIGAQACQAVADYINNLRIGEDVLCTRLYLPAQLFGGSGSETYEVTSLLIALLAGTPGTGDISIAINNNAVIALADVSLTVV